MARKMTAPEMPMDSHMVTAGLAIDAMIAVQLGPVEMAPAGVRVRLIPRCRVESRCWT